MKVFLCGGGDGKQTTKAYEKMSNIINHNKPLLYVPLAMESDKYEASKEYLLNLSKEEKIVALPEEVTLFVNGDIVDVIGERPYYIFEDSNIIEKYG